MRTSMVLMTYATCWKAVEGCEVQLSDTQACEQRSGDHNALHLECWGLDVTGVVKM